MITKALSLSDTIQLKLDAKDSEMLVAMLGKELRRKLLDLINL